MTVYVVTCKIKEGTKILAAFVSPEQGMELIRRKYSEIRTLLCAEYTDKDFRELSAPKYVSKRRGNAYIVLNRGDYWLWEMSPVWLEGL